MSSKAKSAVFLALFLSLSVGAQAEQDFYGIKMKNELWAQNLVLNSGPKADVNDLYQGPVLDSSIFADAVIKTGPERTEFKVNVVNNSTQAISANYEFRDYFLYMKDGKKIPLIDPETQWNLYSVEPKGSVAFHPSLGNLRVRHEDVRMVECSFDLGKTRLFLFPASKKDAVNKLQSPAPPPPPEKKNVKPKNKSAPPKAEPAKKVEPPAPAEPVVKKGTGPIQMIWDWLGMTGPLPKSKTSGVTKSSKPVAPTKTEHAPAAPVALVSGAPSTQEKLDQAIQNFKYVPSSGREGAPAAAPEFPTMEGPGGTRGEAQVIEYNRSFNYITMNLGKRDGLRKDMVVSVLRNGKVVAKAKVKQLRDDVAAAVVSGARLSDIRTGDLISVV